jgi:hypothetical protein
MNKFSGCEGGLVDDFLGRDERVVDSAFIVSRLEEAGATLLALPNTGYSTRLKTSHLEVVQEVKEAFGGEGQGRARLAVPSAARITRMDEAMGWIALIPKDRTALRRIVGARSLVSPVTERHLFSWRRLGLVMGADHKAVQRWHAQAIDMLVAAVGALHRDVAMGRARPG